MKQKKEEVVSVDKTTEQVLLMARRTALLYHSMAEVLIEKLGDKKAKEILKEAIWRYGTECGEQVKNEVLEMGLPLTLENYSKGEDLPQFGWEAKTVKKEGKEYIQVDFCPLAATWLEKSNPEIARIYCYVDQAKYLSYNGIKCTHLKNKLDGDPCCLFDFSEQDNDNNNKGEKKDE